MKRFLALILLSLTFFLANPGNAAVHDGNSPSVLLQGFHWESHASYPWWDVIAANASDIADTGFDMVWLPPSSDAGSDEGYLPRKLYVQSGPYGNQSQLQNAITQLHSKGIKAIADIVINHRVGTTGWGDFTEPAWGTDSVCADDEWTSSTGAPDTGQPYAAARDIDHTKAYVQASIIEWMKWMKNTIGYDGWRYDFTKGYSGYYNGIYNDATSPYFSVAETWPDIIGDYYASGSTGVKGHRQYLADWVSASGNKSAVFDFTTKWQLMLAVQDSQYWRLKDDSGKPIGYVGWNPAKAVTFLDNHDTGSSPGGGQNHWPFPSNGIMQGYAYILTHPGVPSVYWPHVYDWGLKSEIKKLMGIRKSMGLTSTSTVNIQVADTSQYAAIIDAKVAMKIGSGNWNPGTDWTLAASGNNYAVWTMGSGPITNTNRIVTNGVRTVIFMQKQTASGQDIFVKGGHDANLVPSFYATMDEAITYLNKKNTTTLAIKNSDATLDWGTESALDWTCNVWPATWGTKKTYAADGYGEDPENTWGIHWWKFDVSMAGTTGEWYEFKAFMREGSTESWETDIAQAGTPYTSRNHWGKKGFITRVIFGDSWVEFIPLQEEVNTPPSASLGAIPVDIEEGETVSFDASASSDPEDGSNVEVRWDWEGDGNYDTVWSTVKTASHIYTTPGTYQATLQVRDSKGLTDSKSLTITVTEKPNTAPTANLDASPNPAQTGQTVTFDASGSSDPEDGANIQVRFDFNGDGIWDTAFSYTKTATHVYSAAGHYIAKAEVMDSKGLTASDLISVQVDLSPNTPPIAQINASPSSGTTATLFTLDASASSDSEDGSAVQVRFDWESDGTYDTTYSSTKSATHTYSTEGTYTVTVQVKDSEGATDIATVNISVSKNSIQALDIYYKKPTAWGSAYIHYWATLPDAQSTTWPGKKMNDLGNGWYHIAITNQTYAKIVFNANSAPQTTDLSRTGDGWYDGTWHDTNPDDAEAPVTALTSPAAGTTLSGTVTLTASASDNTAVTKVEFYDGTTLIGTDTSAPYSLSWNTKTSPNGPHSLSTKAFDAALNEGVSAPIAVSVNNPNTAPVAALSSDKTTGTTATLFNFDASGSTDAEGAVEVRFDWENDGTYDTSYSSILTATHTYSTIGTKTVKVQVKDSEGLTATATVSVVVELNTTPIMTIHFKNVNNWAKVYAHYWLSTPDSLSTTWPGKAMISEGNNWYYIALTNQTACQILFHNNAGSQSADLTRSGNGWYKDGVWYNSNPDDEIAPTTSLTSPINGASLVGTVTVSATATDNVAVTKVAFYYDSVLIAEDTSAPYSVSWNTALVPSGSHVVKSIAYDEAGNTGTSSATVSTANPNLPPVADAGGDITAFVGLPVQFSAAKSYDPNGSIVSYKWSNGLSGEKPTMTYNQMGTFQITLTVTDNEGATDTDTFNLTVTTNYSGQRGDFREETIYFLMTARFYDGDPANNRPTRAYVTSGNAANNDPAWRGDFKGLTEKLDYIKALGFSAVWLTPVVLNRSDYDFHGYHAWDFNKVDARLESPGYDYQKLINEAHKRGMKIIQDIVLNHTSRYGAKDLYTVKYWGDSNDPEWGDGTAIDYYDVYNPDFEYNGLDYEPISGKNWYNGDLWTKDKPNLAWTDLPYWGQATQYRSPEGYKIYQYQWPNLEMFPNDKFHPDFLKNWEDYTCQIGSIHEDCIDLNTENAGVQQFLIDAYNRYIDMGVDGFRIDTVKHISRLMFNRRFVPAFKERGGENFFMFGEVCTRVNEVWNHNVAPLSTPFYTWAERGNFSADDEAAALEAYNYENNLGTGNQPTSGNHYLSGNNYHAPDYSKSSGLAVIDFPMHWNWDNAGQAYNMRGNDQYYNDATWNVVYVDSHDYGPNTDNRYTGDQDTCAENYSLMFTFRGIPCIYYGSEIQFKKGAKADAGPNAPLEETGRAYYGSHIEGSVNVTDFGVWNNATGEMANTLNHPLSQHLARLNQIRRAIPALQKGQYSNEDINGWMAYKKRFTKDGVDSFALVTVSGGATFNNIPNGTYKDAVTGDVKVVNNNTLVADCNGKGNLRVYVLDLPGNPAPGKIGNDTMYLK